MSAEKKLTARNLVLGRKSIKRHKPLEEYDPEVLRNKDSLEDSVMSPRTRSRAHKENVHSPAAGQSRILKKIKNEPESYLESPGKRSTRLEAKTKSSVDSPGKISLKSNKSFVDEVSPELPEGGKRWNRSLVEKDLASVSKITRSDVNNVPAGSSSVSRSESTKRAAGKKVYSRIVEDDSVDDFCLATATPKSTPTKRVESFDAGVKRTPGRKKDRSISEVAQGSGMNPNINETAQDPALRSTPKKGSRNVERESRTPSPCFHIWPPRNP